MIALPPVQVVTIEQQVRYDNLTNIENRRFNVLKGKRYKEYARLTFLIQANMFMKAVNNEYHTIADANFAVQAWKNYNAYLNY